MGDPKRCPCGTPDAELLDLELAEPLAELALADELLEAAAPLLELGVQELAELLPNRETFFSRKRNCMYPPLTVSANFLNGDVAVVPSIKF